jgi:GrpB-like predicted nucleotidyltransferase (UPF0157 family)
MRKPGQIVLRPVGDLANRATAVVAECRRDLDRLVPGSPVEHVGATALPSGLTKGDVDVNVRLPADRFADAVDTLKRNYAVAQPQNWTATYASFVDESKVLPVGIQVNVIGSRDDFLVPLRDLMARDPALRARYDQVKQRAAALGPQRYWEAKNAFLQELLPQVRPGFPT